MSEQPIFQGFPKDSILQTADRFAADFFDPPREVGIWSKYHSGQFQLVDGVKWYRVGGFGKVFAVFNVAHNERGSAK